MRLTKDQYIYELEQCLKTCRRVFEEYADLHTAKMTYDGDEKASRNRIYSDMCSDTLAFRSAVED